MKLKYNKCNGRLPLLSLVDTAAGNAEISAEITSFEALK